MRYTAPYRASAKSTLNRTRRNWNNGSTFAMSFSPMLLIAPEGIEMAVARQKFCFILSLNRTRRNWNTTEGMISPYSPKTLNRTRRNWNREPSRTCPVQSFLLIAPEGIEIGMFLFPVTGALKLLIAPEGIEISLHLYISHFSACSLNRTRRNWNTRSVQCSVQIYYS